MNRKNQKFDQFRKIRDLPESYEESLVEIVRRVGYNKQLQDNVHEVMSLFDRALEEETERRRDFVAEHGKNIPQGLFPGLNCVPSHVHIQVENNDEQLPQMNSVIPDSHGRITTETFRRPFMSKS